MQPPLLSLDFTDWLVFADWVAEYQQKPKVERWARRIGRSLWKFHLFGKDCRATLYSCDCSSVRIPPNGFEWVDYKNPFYPAGYYWKRSERPYEWVRLSSCHWSNPYSDSPLGSVIDLPVKWQQTRLAYKFFALLNIRARGIPDSVLEEVSNG